MSIVDGMGARMSDETEAAIDFAKKVVLKQGALFLRELLRRQRGRHPGVRIGVARREVRENLLEAIDRGHVTLMDLKAWVQEVEGWGRQHIYLFRVRRPRGVRMVWKEPDELEKRAREAGAGWEAPPDTSFPDELTIGAVNLLPDRMRVSWRQRYDRWHREEELDPEPEVVDGDLIEYRAYRQEPNRAVMRFVLLRRPRRGALFVQFPLGTQHRAACRKAFEDLAAILPGHELLPASISNAIKALDQRELQSAEHATIAARNTKFGARGATVEFDADPSITAWKNVSEVREVRRALKTDAFSGEKGKFRVTLRSGTGMNRDVMMSLSRRDRRIYLASLMTEDEVWAVLDQVLEHGE